MAEIKSTLDLVMERTRHLSLSAEEKESQKKAAVEKKINGVLQKVADGTLKMDECFRALDNLKKSEGTGVEASIISAITNRLNLDRDNKELFTVLTAYCHIEIAQIEKIFSDYRQARSRETAHQIETAKKELAKNHFISGSAVIPNLKSDHNWRNTLAAMRKDFQERMNHAITQMNNAANK
jgi:hypothetical protein